MTPVFIGDLILIFSERGEPPPGRTAAEWKLLRDEPRWRLWQQAPASGWRGTPLVSAAREPWELWLLGELYGSPDETSRALEDFHGEQPGMEGANGHFLLLAWNARTRQWHVWTDRFGTLHVYHGSDGRRAAVGTFSPAVAAAASRRALDWLGLSGFFSYGFFPQDLTHFEDVRILRPSTHSVFDESGRRLVSRRYWEWRHEPDPGRGERETLEELDALLKRVLADQTREGPIAIPISGGLDSRTTVAALKAPAPNLWSYSYGYSGDSVEISIARRVAEARGLPFDAFLIGPYLLEKLEWVLASVEGFQDLTQCRQAAAADEIGRHADFVIAAHWGDVWLDDIGLPEEDATISSAEAEERIFSHTVRVLEKRGRAWLLDTLCAPRLAGGNPSRLLRESLRPDLARLGNIRDADFRVKAFKTEQWSFRWTTTSLRMFQPAAFPRLPFYDTRLSDFFATIPSELVRGRRLQIEYLKRFAPDLAGITWQASGFDLFSRPSPLRRLSRRALGKLGRLATRRRVVERNWEVQLLPPDRRPLLEERLLSPGLRLHDLVPPTSVRGLLDDFYSAPWAEGRGYAVSMLLTFSAWLERYG